MPLSLGLNVNKASTSSSASKATARRPIQLLDDDSNSENEQVTHRQPDRKAPGTTIQSISTFEDAEGSDSEKSSIELHKNNKAADTRRISPPKRKAQYHAEAATPSSSATLSTEKVVRDAEKQDTSIFDYDAHYETSSSAAQAAQRRAASQKEAQTRTPKYMSGMKSAANQRQRDHLRAEDKRLQRERELDPDGVDKEAFVTGAYKARQEEVRKLEEEEKARENEEEMRRDKGGMGGFWRGMMDEDEKRRTELAQRGADGGVEVLQELDKERELADRARTMNEHGASVQINEEGVVADKRQLLKGGLNVAANPTGANALPEKHRTLAQRANEGHSERESQQQRDAKQAMGERHARMMEHQLEEARKRKAEEDAAELQKRDMASKSKKTDKDISSAKERFLQRKKEAEERKRLGLEE